MTNQQKLKALRKAYTDRKAGLTDLYGHLSDELLLEGIDWYRKRSDKAPNEDSSK